MGNHKVSIPDDLWRIAAAQAGVFAHHQVAALGLTRHVIQRALDDHIWWPVTRGLYATSPTPTWLGLAHGGLLLGGEGAVLHGRAAAHLLEWGPPPARIEVAAPRRVRDRGVWTFRNAALPGVGEPKHTLPERTVVELCSEAEPVRALHLLADAVASRRTTPSRILRELEALPRLPRRALVSEVLGDVTEGIMSALEDRFARDVERRHGLPSPTRQVAAQGAVLDATYDEYRVVVELDGRLGHEGSAKWKDFRRDNRNVREGWAPLRYGWDDVVGNPCAVAAEVGALLRAKGWPGEHRRCPSCAAVIAA